ncbi:MAG TPA: class I SAM-dependent methyltransferase [Thermoleophilaceae bacterium]|nr:class I SAM-dependent methyltransferase [Thermoleophilaceae bacterium]
MSEQYTPDNLLDRLSDPATLKLHYDRLRERERALLGARLDLAAGGDVLAVGCGRDPGRHLFPAPAWRMTGVELEEEWPRRLVDSGELDVGLVGRAGELDRLGDASFDVVLYRYVLHHIAFQGPLAPVFAEASRLLRPGGVLVAMEPGALHPVGAGLALANRIGLGVAVHGTPDDIPLTAARLERESHAAGLDPEVVAVTYGWRRLPPPLQRATWRLDGSLGERPRAARFGHTLMLVARR